MYQIIEDTPALAELPNTKALTLYKEFLVNVPYLFHNVEDKPMMVQVTLAELEMGFKHRLNKKGKALSVHCLVHNFNLYLQGASRKC